MLGGEGGGSGLVMGKEVERYFYDIILKKQSWYIIIFAY